MRKRKLLRNLGELQAIISQNIKVAMTTGAFDVPHKAHRTYIAKAREYGDVLVVLLQSDEFIRQRKGDGRPKRKQKIRVRRLSRDSYACDYIFVVRTLEEFYRTIENNVPHTLVLSVTTEDEDTCPKTMIEKFGNKMPIVVLPPQSDVHSTHIIARRKL